MLGISRWLGIIGLAAALAACNGGGGSPTSIRPGSPATAGSPATVPLGATRSVASSSKQTGDRDEDKEKPRKLAVPTHGLIFTSPTAPPQTFTAPGGSHGLTVTIADPTIASVALAPSTSGGDEDEDERGDDREHHHAGRTTYLVTPLTPGTTTITVIRKRGDDNAKADITVTVGGASPSPSPAPSPSPSPTPTPTPSPSPTPTATAAPTPTPLPTK